MGFIIINMGNSETSMINSLDFVRVIGKGSFGCVWLAYNRKSNEKIAVKVMRKSVIVFKKGVFAIMNERNLLTSLNHPFVVKMKFAVQDRNKLYLGLNLLEGGDLRSLMKRRGIFTEEESRFYTACILLGLEYLHRNKIAHRDIKPENLLLDSQGYLSISDLGIASKVYDNGIGSPGYMAPESMYARGKSGLYSDFFSLGVCLFEFMMGQKPYNGRNFKAIREDICTREITLHKHNVPPGWSPGAIDFITRLLKRKSSNRLGYGGIHEVKNHVWIKDFCFRKLLKKKIKPPIAPKILLSELQRQFKIQIDDSGVKNVFNDVFSGYDYNENKSTCR